MKYCLIILLIILSGSLFSQINSTPRELKVACQTKEELQAFNNEIKMLKKQYYANHKGPSNNSVLQPGHVLLGWPMRANSEYDFVYNYFNLQNYVDQDRFSTDSTDYNCGRRTYDGHDASDINLYPFWWRMMDNNYVMAVAAAPGIIFSRNDGNFDHNCSKVGSPNNIVILHDDSTTTRYLHLKSNSLTTKPDNSRVEQGEFLGFIGSSGRSSNPHLHFAVYDKYDNLIEPYFETANPQCNVLNNDTWWQNQRPYWEPQINRLMTHSNPPTLDFCPGDEAVYAKNQFNSGDQIYTGIAFMDAQNGDVAACTLTQPNGIVYNSWNVPITSTKSRTYKTNLFTLPSGNPGTWTFRATYRSKVYAHFFTVGCNSSHTVSGSISGNDGYITGNYISSTAIHTGSSNSKVLYQAANYIELKPGFQATAGIHFKARIKPCTYTE